MSLSRAVTINNQLLRNATADGFIPLPVYNYHNESLWGGDLTHHSCNYANTANSYRTNRDEFYPERWASRPRIADAFSREFGGTKEQYLNMSIRQLYYYADRSTARTF